MFNENILPMPYKKVKCLECGEEVCDNLNYKIGHLYNKHNCKPSVNEYKAKRMLKQYFPQSIKESINNPFSKWRRTKNAKIDNELINIGDKVKVWEVGDPILPNSIKKGEILYGNGVVLKIYTIKDPEKYYKQPDYKFYVKIDDNDIPQFIYPYEISKY